MAPSPSAALCHCPGPQNNCLLPMNAPRLYLGATVSQKKKQNKTGKSDSLWLPKSYRPPPVSSVLAQLHCRHLPSSPLPPGRQLITSNATLSHRFLTCPQKPAPVSHPATMRPPTRALEWGASDPGFRRKHLPRGEHSFSPYLRPHLAPVSGLSAVSPPRRADPNPNLCLV